MRNGLSILFGTSLFLTMVLAPLGYYRWRDREYRNFHVVEEGVLYRSGQLPLHRLQEIVFTRGIRTVISMREGAKTDDQAEEAWSKERGLNFVRISPGQWWPNADGRITAEDALKQFREVMDHPANYPVLVHCYAGYHRTGAICAVFRMDYQGWTNEAALAEMRVLGYTILDDHQDVLSYLSRYRPQSQSRQLHGVPVNRQIKRGP
ncbi:MAG: hypothetical protein FJ303_09710 [Planctomycetes bacterium]|nr:hypothetical protein [Planctomycetota bacterium]